MLAARLIRAFSAPANGADRRLYSVAPGGVLPEHVIVSAVAVDGQEETFIFAANSRGYRQGKRDELPGSFRGARDHAEALRRAGYAVEGGG